MKRNISIILMFVLILNVLSGCTTSNQEGQDLQTGGQDLETSPNAEYKDTLIVGSSEDPVLNPWEALGYGDMIVCRQIYDTLFYLGADGKLVPGLAEDYEWVDDTHLKFNLRKGVKFHDGSDFTAEDVKYWYDNLKDYPRQAVRNQAFAESGHEVVDEHTVIIKLKYPFVGAVDQTSRHCIGPKKLIEEIGVANYSVKPIGTGPYVMDEFIPGTQAKMTRFDDYWQGAAATEHIVVKVIPEESSRIIEIETGGVDMLINLSTQSFKHFEGVNGVSVKYDEAFQFVRLMFSHDEPLLDNKDLRYALVHAVDVDSIVDSVYDGFWKSADTMWSPLVEGATPREKLKYDLDLAKDYMAKAGYSNENLKFRIHAVNVLEKKVCEILQEMWKPLGVELEIFHNPLATYQASHKHQIAVNIGSAPFLANTISTYKWGGQTALMPPETGRLGELEHLAHATIDDEKRQEYLDELQDILWEDLRVFPIAIGVMGYAVSDDIEGFKFDPYGAPYLHTYKIKK